MKAGVSPDGGSSAAAGVLPPRFQTPDPERYPDHYVVSFLLEPRDGNPYAAPDGDEPLVLRVGAPLEPRRGQPTADLDDPLDIVVERPFVDSGEWARRAIGGEVRYTGWVGQLTGMLELGPPSLDGRGDASSGFVHITFRRTR